MCTLESSPVQFRGAPELPPPHSIRVDIIVTCEDAQRSNQYENLLIQDAWNFSLNWESNPNSGRAARSIVETPRGKKLTSDAAYREWLLAKTWLNLLAFSRIIAILVPLIAVAIDVPIIGHRQWESDAAWAWLIGWHLVTEVWCVGFLLVDRFCPALRSTETGVTLFSLGTLVLSTWFGLVSWVVYRDLSGYAVGSVFIAAVICTPRPIRQPAYFLCAACLVGFVAATRTPEMGPLFPLVVNPLAVAIICLQLDRYTTAQNLELFAEKQRVQIERERADQVLFNVLPAAIAEELKINNAVKAVKFEKMGILFADIVGFTHFSRALPPDALILILNQIFSSFDDSVEQLGLEKIKTIGDAYMTISVESALRPSHLARLAQLALEMLVTIRSYNLANGTDLQMRIGMHVGPAVAGVIGVKRFLYDVWGDAVNVASRMESSGQPGRVHVSTSVKEQLAGEFSFESREKIEIKGRGVMQTYFLIGAGAPI